MVSSRSSRLGGAVGLCLVLGIACEQSKWKELPGDGSEAGGVAIEQPFTPAHLTPGREAFCQAVYVARHAVGANILAEAKDRARGLATTRLTFDGELHWKEPVADTLSVWLRVPHVIVSDRDNEAASVSAILNGHRPAARQPTYFPFQIRQRTAAYWIASFEVEDATLSIQWDLGTAMLVMPPSSDGPVSGMGSASVSFVCGAVAAPSP